MGNFSISYFCDLFNEWFVSLRGCGVLFGQGEMECVFFYNSPLFVKCKTRLGLGVDAFGRLIVYGRVANL